MSSKRKIANKRRYEEQLKQKKRRKEIAKKVLLVSSSLACCALLAFGGVSYYKTTKDIQYRMTSLPDWEKVGIGQYDVKIEERDGIISLEDYVVIRQEKSKEELEKSKNILGEELYNWYLEGIGSDYFTHSCIVDYEEMVEQVKALSTDGELFKELLNTVDKDKRIEPVTECHSEDCEMAKFIESYTVGEVKEALLEVHKNYETLLEYYIDIVELSDDDLQLAYQEELVTNLDYVKDINVDIRIVNPLLLEVGDTAIEYADKAGKIETRTFNKDYLEDLRIMPLYNDKDFYSVALASKAPSLMSQLLGSKSGIITNNENIVNVTDVVDLDSWIAKQEPPKENSSKSINDANYTTYRLTGYDIYDAVKVIYDVKSVEHGDFPTLDEVREKVEAKAKLYIAESYLQEDVANVYSKIEEQSEGNGTSE